MDEMNVNLTDSDSGEEYYYDSGDLDYNFDLENG